MDWDTVRNYALSLINNQVGGGTTHAQLDDWALSTGYRDAPNPHQNTGDLLYVFAANLLNSGLPGPNIEKFASLVKEIVLRHLVDPKTNNISRATSVGELASFSHRYLEENLGFEFTRHRGKTDYKADIQGLAIGTPRKEAIVNDLLDTVSAFINYLVIEFDGSATKFHQVLDIPCQDINGLVRIESIKNKLQSFKRMGLALAMNFLKDSQMSACRGEQLADLSDRAIAHFVKPDLHVLRLMFIATGRHLSTSLGAADIIGLQQEVSEVLFSAINPQHGSIFDRAYTSEHCLGGDLKKRGAHRCIADVVHWSQNINPQISPFEIDRILFLIGSGNYSGPGPGGPSAGGSGPGPGGPSAGGSGPSAIDINLSSTAQRYGGFIDLY